MRKSWKKSTSLILVLVMLLSIAPIGLAYDFDKSQSEWAETELGEAYDFGLTYPDVMNNFTRPITREEFCTIVVKFYEKLSEKTAVVGDDPFTDTDNPEILKAYKLQIVNGISTTEFAPNTNITRQEICVMIFRALGAAIEGLVTSEPETFNFTDAGSIASWAIDAVKYCNSIGVMKGTTETTISPLDNTTREQGIILLKRAFETGGLTEEIPDLDEETNDRIGMISSAIDWGLVRDILRNRLNKPEPVTESNKGEIKELMDIGRGYDIFGKYASGSSLKQPVLDMDKLISRGQVMSSQMAESDFRETSGTSISEYAHHMTTKVKASGGFMGFGGSVDSNFNSGETSSSENYFMTLTFLISRLNIFIDATCNYKDFVKPEVKTILDTGMLNGRAWGPDEIFDTFGSYVLVDGIFGGRLDYNVSANKTASTSYDNFKVCVKASYNVGFASASAEVEHGSATNYAQYNSRKSERVLTYGGNAQNGKTLTADVSGAELGAWVESVNETPKLVEYGNSGSRPMIPIWELCSTPERALELETAFKKRAAEGAAEAANIRCITGLKLRSAPTMNPFLTDPTNMMSLANQLPDQYRDANNDVWHNVGIIGATKSTGEAGSSFEMFYGKTYALYVRYGYSRGTDPTQPPIIGVIVANLKQNESAQTIFERRFKSIDTDAKLVPVYENQSDPMAEVWNRTLGTVINENGFADSIRLYYVTSTNTKSQPITRLGIPPQGLEVMNGWERLKDSNGNDQDTAEGFHGSGVVGNRYIDYSFRVALRMPRIPS